jgi:hypothetical protein
MKTKMKVLLLLVTTLALLGCHKDDLPVTKEYSLYILGKLDGTHVSMQVDDKSIASGFLTSERPNNLAFLLLFTAAPGDKLEIRVNEHTDSSFKASFVLPSTNGHILASIQADTVLFETEETAPIFK